ncbi:mechanosensitive ion channel [Myxococcota bacterium]|nr:mechanosensitive ion channel [Myxococcota bacterium]
MNIDSLWANVQPYLVDFGFRLIAVVIIYMAGKIGLGIIDKVLKKVFSHSKIEPTIVKFLQNMIHVAVNVFVFLAIMGKLGIETTSLVAILGAATLAVGFALQGSLANFSSGVLIMLFRPFKVGDFVEVGGKSGLVHTIGILACELTTPDNKRIIMPNGKIMGDTIMNFTAEATRRIDLVVGVSYGSDLKKTRAVILEELQKNKLVLAEPVPTVAVTELGESSVDFFVRPWVNTADYWTVRSEVLEAVKIRLDAEGIEIPFPQRDIHMRGTNPTA